MGEFRDAGATDEEIDMITWKNTARFFRFDPFTAIPKERSTVGALKALATDVDLTDTGIERFHAVPRGFAII